MEQLIEDGTLQACALKRLRYTTAGQQAAAHRETAALSALCGVVHIAQLVFADCYREPITKEWSWALIMRCAFAQLPPPLPFPPPPLLLFNMFFRTIKTVPLTVSFC